MDKSPTISDAFCRISETILIDEVYSAYFVYWRMQFLQQRLDFYAVYYTVSKTMYSSKGTSSYSVRVNVHYDEISSENIISIKTKGEEKSMERPFFLSTVRTQLNIFHVTRIFLIGTSA